MKKSIFVFAILFSFIAHGQQNIESAAVEGVILNYIEKKFENDFDNMNKSLHPRLAKRGLNPDRSLSADPRRQN